MAFLKSMDIAASGLTAQRMRMDVIADNVANMNTTRTATGEPYRRRFVIMEEKQITSFADRLSGAINKRSGDGVDVSEIMTDESPFRMDYNPDHPDADANGYVRMPNVEYVTEMVDLMSATRSYEANVTAINAFKSMALKALEIGV